MTQQFGGRGGAQDPPGRAGSNERLQDKASKIGERALDQGKHALEGQTRTLADKAGQLADSVRAAADNLEQQDNAELSRYVSSFASGISSVADGLRNKNADDLLHDVNAIARRNPAMFVAGAVALGFALTRFARASGQRSHDEYTFDQFDEHRDEYSAREFAAGGYAAHDPRGYGRGHGAGSPGDATGRPSGLGDVTPTGDMSGNAEGGTGTGRLGEPGVGFASGSLGDSRDPDSRLAAHPLGTASSSSGLGTRSAGGTGGGGAAGGRATGLGAAGLHGNVDSTGAPRSTVGASRSPLAGGTATGSADNGPGSGRRSDPNTTGGTPL